MYFHTSPLQDCSQIYHRPLPFPGLSISVHGAVSSSYPIPVAILPLLSMTVYLYLVYVKSVFHPYLLSISYNQSVTGLHEITTYKTSTPLWLLRTWGIHTLWLFLFQRLLCKVLFLPYSLLFSSNTILKKLLTQRWQSSASVRHRSLLIRGLAVLFSVGLL